VEGNSKGVHMCFCFSGVKTNKGKDRGEVRVDAKEKCRKYVKPQTQKQNSKRIPPKG